MTYEVMCAGKNSAIGSVTHVVLHENDAYYDADTIESIPGPSVQHGDAYIEKIKKQSWLELLQKTHIDNSFTNAVAFGLFRLFSPIEKIRRLRDMKRSSCDRMLLITNMHYSSNEFKHYFEETADGEMLLIGAIRLNYFTLKSKPKAVGRLKSRSVTSRYCLAPNNFVNN